MNQKETGLWIHYQGHLVFLLADKNNSIVMEGADVRPSDNSVRYRNQTDRDVYQMFFDHLATPPLMRIFKSELNPSKPTKNKIDREIGLRIQYTKDDLRGVYYAYYKDIYDQELIIPLTNINNDTQQSITAFSISRSIIYDPAFHESHRCSLGTLIQIDKDPDQLRNHLMWVSRQTRVPLA